MQGQAWSALPVGLWSRLAGFAVADLYAALERGELCWGISIRGTLHLVSAREHPAYAAAAQTESWHRAAPSTGPGMDALRAAVLDFAGGEARTGEQIRAFAEAWVAAHPDAIEAVELESQRSVKWRPIYRWSRLMRVPSGGSWGAKTPTDHRAAPAAQAAVRDPLGALVRCHLRAFGPAAAEDVACWIGWRTAPVAQRLDAMSDELDRFEDSSGRVLHDIPGAPRPDADTPAPVRLLGAFDSMLLAYAVRRRGRIISEELRAVVYQQANLQIRPTFLVDGMVAGTWSCEVRRREAVLTARPCGRLGRGVEAELRAEGEGLLRTLYPRASAHAVEVE